MMSWTKSKRLIRGDNFSELWNSQSIEVRGTIYVIGGTISNSRTYLKQTMRLNEETMCFEKLADMHCERDAHGIVSWKNRYIIAVGSWHGDNSTKSCEMYDVQTNKWSMLPSLADETCAPGLVVIDDRYLYKIGGNNDISQVSMLDLEKPTKWTSINTLNKFGRKHTINRCLLYPLGTQKQETEIHKSVNRRGINSKARGKISSIQTKQSGE